MGLGIWDEGHGIIDKTYVCEKGYAIRDKEKRICHMIRNKETSTTKVILEEVSPRRISKKVVT